MSIREDAVLALEVAGNYCADPDAIPMWEKSGAADIATPRSRAERLVDWVLIAIGDAVRRNRWDGTRLYLEAAALLRDGWIPGDPITLKKGAPRR